MQAVDLAYGVEPIERNWHLNTPLPLQVAVQPRKKALQEAKKDRDSIVFWTDGLRLDTGKARLAVVWLKKKSDKWQEKRRYLGENKESFDVELWAISDALELSIKKTKNRSPTTVIVFIDSHTAIVKILEPKVRPGEGAIRDLIYRNTLNIRNNGHTLVLQ